MKSLLKKVRTGFSLDDEAGSSLETVKSTGKSNYQNISVILT